MFNKKFMLMAIFIVGLIAVSAVSANEINATDEVIGEEMAIDDNLEVIQEDYLSTTYTVSGNTFDDIQNTIDLAKSGDTIELSGTYYGNGKEISINKPMTIDGKGQTTLDARKLSRIFMITDNDREMDGFSLKNINFINGNASDDKGGAIFFDYAVDVEISGCTFKDNAAMEGGAIFLYGRDFEISGCVFRENTARDGGAISSSGNNVNMSSCNFINDKAFRGNYLTHGGAIRIGFDTHNHYLDDCSFINCSSGGSSVETNGAIYSEASGLYITNCEFANGMGGAIEAKKNTKIVNCNFTGYTDIVKKGNVYTYSNGPVVYLGGYGSNMSNCNFINNTCGKIVEFYSDGGTLSYCNFRNNDVYSNILNVKSYDESLIYKCNFIDNKLDDDSPAISISPMLFSVTSGYNNLTIRDIVMEGYVKNIYGGAVTVEDNILTITNSASAKGQITVRISNKTFTKSVNAGITQFNLSSVKSGTYLANIFYSGDNNEYKPSEMNIPITIKSNIELKSADVTKYFGGSEKFTVKLTKNGKVLSNVNVKITANGKTSTVATDSNGQASLNLDLPVGAFAVVSEYDGVKTTSKANVKSTIAVSDAVGTYLNSKVTAMFLNTNGKALANTKVTFKVGTVAYSATTNSNGVATANIELGTGTYDVAAINPVNKEEKQFKLAISKADSKIALVSSQNNGDVTLAATLTPAGATGSVVFNVNGVNRNVAIKNGKATLTLNDLEAGDHVVTASYGGDANLKASASSTVKFNVAEVYPVLTADDLTKTYGNADKFVVNLKDSKGNAIANAVVNIDINGQITPITTDSNGEATMDISLKPESYDATATYGDVKATAKITVKKATPKITASKKTFKVSVKTKKYTITLKTNKNKVMKNKKVTLKVNGKTYSAKTNSKGKATFKITKLTKKGAFNAVIKFAGNSYYNKVTKTVKITVKK